MPNFTRKIYTSLDLWLKNKDRKPLILRGARQVGKSYAIRSWAKEKFGEGGLFELNLEENNQIHYLFEGNLDPNNIIKNLSLATQFSEAKHKVIFLDEIQACPKAVIALRYFYEKRPDIIIISAGSLIEFILFEIGFPVGRVESLYMHPLSFSEFILAVEGYDFYNKYINLECFSEVNRTLHEELLFFLKLYLRIGGMPKVVSKYIDTKNLEEVSKEHRNIITGYQDDLRKHSKKGDWEAITEVFSNLPFNICKGNLKYVRLSSTFQTAKIKKSLELFSQAHLVNKIISTYASKLPLESMRKNKFFKLSFLDIGLLQYLLGFNWINLDPKTELCNIYDGVFTEQFVAQELIAAAPASSNYVPHYWDRQVQGSSAEVDFIIEYDNFPVPLEIKSGARGKLKSLKIYQNEFSPKMSIVASQNNFSKLNEVYFIPLYQVGKLRSKEI